MERSFNTLSIGIIFIIKIVYLRHERKKTSHNALSDKREASTKIAQ